MEPLEYDIEFPRGDTCPISFTLTDANGEPLVPTAETEIYFTVKKNFNTQTALIQKRLSTSGITVENGICSLTLTHLDTASMSYGKYRYDVQLKDGSYVKTLIIGQLTLTNEATFLSNE